MSVKKCFTTSSCWLQRHFSDKYVQQAQKKRLRSRSWFKLDNIQHSDKIFRPGMTVIDLGSAPGGWSKYVATQMKGRGRIIACDILPMDPILGVHFLQGDFRDPLLLQILLKYIGKKKVHVVLSDMAPNISGISVVDISRSIYLVELVLDMCRDVLVRDGVFLVKVFHGEGFDKYLKEVRSLFTKVKIRKPDSSRTRSREVYIVATGHKT